LGDNIELQNPLWTKHPSWMSFYRNESDI